MKLGQMENVKFYYNPEEWIFFDDLLKELPILENYSKVEYIKKKKKTIIEYNDYVYFVNIFDYIIKNGTFDMFNLFYFRGIMFCNRILITLKE